MSAMDLATPEERECMNRIAADIQTIVRTKIGITDNEMDAFIKVAELEIRINDILKSKADDRVSVMEEAQRRSQFENLEAMAQSEIRDQVLARKKFLDKISELGYDQKNITLNNLAEIMKIIEKRKIDNQWDQNELAFDAYVSQFDTMEEEIKDLLKGYYNSFKDVARKTANQIKTNAFPILCYIMALLCLLPDSCRQFVIEQLQGTPIGYIASLSFTPEACMYWKANTAGYFVGRIRDLTPEDINGIMARIYGAASATASAAASATASAAARCREFCYALLLSFNNIAGLAEGRFYEALSKLSTKLQLVDIILDVDDAASIRSDTTVYSIASARSDTSLAVQVLVPIATRPADIQREVVTQFNSTNAFLESMRGRAAVMQYGAPGAADSSLTINLDAANRALAYGLLSPPPDTPMNERGDRIIENQYNASQSQSQSQSDSVYPDLTADALAKRQKVDGGRRRKRKSMRHKKKRSTLKRRRIKRRRTRKGKKRRHTKKRR